MKDEIEMIERNGVFVPFKDKVVRSVATQRTAIKERKPPPIKIEKILTGIVEDFFKVLRREMFR